MKDTTLLVIAQGTSEITGDDYSCLLVAETGEILYISNCSGHLSAYNDLYLSKPGRIEKLIKRFGQYEVKFLNETDITPEEMTKRNNNFVENYEANKQCSTNI